LAAQDPYDLHGAKMTAAVIDEIRNKREKERIMALADIQK